MKSKGRPLVITQMGWPLKGLKKLYLMWIGRYTSGSATEADGERRTGRSKRYIRCVTTNTTAPTYGSLKGLMGGYVVGGKLFSTR